MNVVFNTAASPRAKFNDVLGLRFAIAIIKELQSREVRLVEHSYGFITSRRPIQETSLGLVPPPVRSFSSRGRDDDRTFVVKRIGRQPIIVSAPTQEYADLWAAYHFED